VSADDSFCFDFVKIKQSKREQASMTMIAKLENESFIKLVTFFWKPEERVLHA
jgi:hypothetical protein